ncbi:hypothetical protein TNCV_5070351 [Trichonephila clavipes]|nr:hypothetical protein TNCV_5070351 [Trichonephila clavipes]
MEEECMSSGMVRRWVRDFKMAEDVHDEARAGRPSSDETIAKVEAAMLEDRRTATVRNCAKAVIPEVSKTHN